MLKRHKLKKETIFSRELLNKAISELAVDLKISVTELEDKVKQFILDQVIQWKSEKVEFVDSEYNLIVVNTGEIIKINSVPSFIMRKIKSYFKNVVKDIRKQNIQSIIDKHIDTLVYGVIYKSLENNSFVNALDICFKVPHKHFLTTDLLEENSKYLFYVSKSQKNGEVFLTRTSYGFFITLLKLYIPEIRDGIIEIIKLYRVWGGKIYVFFKSPIENAISHCLGGNSNKLQHMMNELSGEKICFIDVEKGPDKAINSILKLERFFHNVILHKENNIYYIYVDYLPVYKIIQKNMKHIVVIEMIFQIQIKLVFISSKEEYMNMLKVCFEISAISELETIQSLIGNIHNLYKTCPSVFCVKLLISSITVEKIFKSLVKSIEIYDPQKVVDKLMKNDSSIIDYKNKK